MDAPTISLRAQKPFFDGQEYLYRLAKLVRHSTLAHIDDRDHGSAGIRR
jgi:hypothetical protein